MPGPEKVDPPSVPVPGDLQPTPVKWEGGRLKDPRKERLALLLAEENSALTVWPEMAERAGYSTKNHRKQYFRSVVLRCPDLQIRILQLKGDAAPLPDGVDIRDEVLGSLRDTREKARIDRDWTAVNRSNELIGKSTGMFTDVIRHSDPFDEMGPSELEQTIMALMKDPITRGMVERALEKFRADAQASDPSAKPPSETRH